MCIRISLTFLSTTVDRPPSPRDKTYGYSNDQGILEDSNMESTESTVSGRVYFFRRLYSPSTVGFNPWCYSLSLTSFIG